MTSAGKPVGRMGVTAAAVLVSLAAAWALAPAGAAEASRTTRRILVCGGRTAIVEVGAPDDAGTVEWSWPGSTREGWVLPDGNVLLAV
ncbi:MAG: hypothetical protein ACKOTB_19125, partial [Planctomycetia bacterium]